MRTPVCLLLMFALAGCNSFKSTKKFDNPVVGPPPKRVRNLLTEVPPATTEAEPSGVVQAGGETTDTGDVVFAAGSSETAVKAESRGEIAALVNGVPIFMDEILEPVAYGIEMKRKQLATAPLTEQEKKQIEGEFQRFRREYVRTHIRPHIERQLLLRELKSKFKKEQLDGLTKHLDEQFKDKLKEMMRVEGAATESELDAKLRKQNTSVEALRTSSRNQMMAQYYVSQKSMPKLGFDRPEQLEYYQEHLDDYAIPGEVKWQQIFVRYADHGGKTGTRKLIEQIAADLQAGADFTALAKKHSKGPTAKKGGTWDWTTADSLADKNVEAALFTLPIGELSEPLENDAGMQIVRVTDRHDASRKPFEDVQTEIKDTLKKAAYQRAADALLQDLLDNADIRTMFDDEEGSSRNAGIFPSRG